MTHHTPHQQSEPPQGFDVLASIRRLIAQDRGHIQRDHKVIHPPIAPFARVPAPDEDAESTIDAREPRLLLDRTDLIERIRLSRRLHLGEAATDAMQDLTSPEAETHGDATLTEQSDLTDEDCDMALTDTISDQCSFDAYESSRDFHEPGIEPAAPEAPEAVTAPPVFDLPQADFGLGAEQEELPSAPVSQSQPLPPAPPVAAADPAPLQSARSQAIARAIARPSVNRVAHQHPGPVRRDFDEDMNLHLFAPTDNDLPNGSVLRNLIREVIRQELHGEMGGRFSRNLRTVIRQEVAAALEAQITPLIADARHDGLQQQ